MEVIQGNNTYVQACLDIAHNLPQYFTQEGLRNLGNDINAHQLFVILDSGAVKGFITLIHKSAHVAEISWMAVHPQHQRQGHGSRLMDFVSTKLKNTGFKLLEVKTLSAEADYTPYEQTRHFYDKCGFMLVDNIDPFPGWEPGNPCAVYVKIL